jgi:hypothetical protein
MTWNIVQVVEFIISRISYRYRQNLSIIVTLISLSDYYHMIEL